MVLAAGIVGFILGVNLGFLFAGLMVAIWLLFSPPAMLYGNGVVYFHIPAMILVLGVLTVYGAVWLCTRHRQTQREERGLAQVQIGIDGRQVSLLGEVDTGNRLSDPFSGLPVVLCRYQSVKELLSAPLIAYFERSGPDRIEKAAEQGNKDAQRALADCYANGWGVPKDPGQAAWWREKAKSN